MAISPPKLCSGEHMLTVECIVHSGLSLMKQSLTVDHNSFLFTAAKQLNLGGPSTVQDSEHYTQNANFNLIAGQRAIEMSDFLSAFSLFNHGITFL
jgi:predicted ATPase